MFSSTLIALVLAASPVAFGKLFTTSPVASTTFPAGQPATVNWQDDGSAPNLQEFGPSDIGLFTGSVNQQVLLQPIATAIDVSKQNSIQWTPSANVGPDGNKYFIRFTSNGLKDPAQPNFPAEAFSAMFTLSGMTGEFNATIQSMIAGSAGPSSATASSPSAAPSSAAHSSAAPKSDAVTSAHATVSATPQNDSSNGAGRIASGLLGVVGVAVVLSSVLV